MVCMICGDNECSGKNEAHLKWEAAERETFYNLSQALTHLEWHRAEMLEKQRHATSEIALYDTGIAGVRAALKAFKNSREI